MLSLVFLLTLPLSLHSIVCPCDTTPDTCDTHCCCDVSCSAEQVLTFTCATFTLSDSKLCCRDELALTSGGVYQSVRKCSSNIVCLEGTPSSFGQFSNGSKSEEVVLKSELGESEETVPFVVSTQYRDSDLLLQTDGVSTPTRLMFPVQFHGDLCALSPVLFYSEIQSSCRKKVKVDAVDGVCKAGDMLDFEYYLTKLLAFPDTSATQVDLSQNIVFYCLDSTTGVKETCSPADPTPTIKDSACLNAVSELEIRLRVSPDSMVITLSTVTITLTSLPTSLTHVSQTFSITYKPASQLDNISGNFGYIRGSHILSGYVTGVSVVMNSDPSLRVLSLFSSTDCSTFTSYPIKFGTGYYTGCKLELPFYNFEIMSSDDQLKEYCTVIRNISGTVFGSSDGVVVGSTGSASTTDPAQWVYVGREPDPPTPSNTENTVRCDDVISHKTYKIFYTEVGVDGNLQAVITRVKVQYFTQNVILYCSNTHCSTNKQQYILLSNSVQFVYNPPDPRDRYKVNPRTTALLPLDFFYPLTGAGVRWGGGVWWGALVWWASSIWVCN